VHPARKKLHASGVLVTLDDPLFEQPAMIPTPFTEHASALIGALSGIDNVAFVVASSRRVPQLARRRRDWEPDPVTPGFPDCWIMIELSSKPARRRLVHGAGSIVISAG
jgi:hypothetical protein